MDPARRVGVPRLYHFKSRNGCRRCRARRVKNNCHRHGVTCDYDRQTSRTGPVAPRTPPCGPVPNPIITPSPNPQPPPKSTSHSYWDLRAFHHFAVATSATLPGTHDPEVRDCYIVQVPILALSHPPLWNEMVALAALHILEKERQTMTPDPGLKACREAALEAALQTYRPSLSELGPHNADAAGFTAILLLIDAFAMLRDRPLTRLHGNDEEDANNGGAVNSYEPPMQWLRIVRGARAVLEAVLAMAAAHGQEDNGQNGPTTTGAEKLMSILTIVGSYPTAHYVPTAALVSTPSPLAPLSDGPAVNPFLHLLTPLAGEPQQSPEVYDAYVGAVRQLQRIQAAILTSGGSTSPTSTNTPAKDNKPHALLLCRGMLSFPCLVPPLFLDLVERRERRALAILAHFWALVTHVGWLWWVGDTPGREVRAIYAALPREYRGLVRGALEVVDGVDVEVR